MSAKDRAKLEAGLKKMKEQYESAPAAVQPLILRQIERLEDMSGARGQSLAEATFVMLHAVVNAGPPVPGEGGYLTWPGK